MMVVKIVPTRNGPPAEKLVEIEICFSDVLLSELRLVRF